MILHSLPGFRPHDADSYEYFCLGGGDLVCLVVLFFGLQIPFRASRRNGFSKGIGEAEFTRYQGSTAL
jgi:hypothetical protein